MRDAFGDALQKISSAAHKPSSSSELLQPKAAAEPPAVPDLSAIASPSITVIEVPRSADSRLPEISKQASNSEVINNSVEVDADASANLTDATSQLAADRRSPLTFLLDHRRQTAAVVVLICIVTIWMEEGPSRTLFTFSNEQTSPGQTSAAADADSLLSDFDAVQVKPLREPADPVEPSSPDPFPFSIPSDESEASVTSDPAASNVSQATTQLPPATSPSPSKDDASEQSPFSPVSSSASHSVRFTGQIEPMK